MDASAIISRSEAILTKYEKYTSEGQGKSTHEKSDDGFQETLAQLTEQYQELSLKADENANEKNRAMKAALNAEMRRAKSLLLESGSVRLGKVVKKGKAVTKEVIEDRQNLTEKWKEDVAAIPDGVYSPKKRLMPQGTGKATSPSREINLDGNISRYPDSDPDYFQHSAETSQFRQDFETAKTQQDRSLDNIGIGLETLRGVGGAMAQEMVQQDAVLDAIEEKVDNVNADLKTNNMKLKALVTKMRSSRNMCLDIVLICIILGIALYIFEMVK